MHARSAARQDGRVRWFHHKKSHILNLRFEDLSGTGGSPSRTDSNNECIKFAANNMQDLLSGCLAVDLWIGRIAKLLGHKVIGVLSKNFFSLIDGALHQFRSVSQ